MQRLNRLTLVPLGIALLLPTLLRADPVAFDARTERDGAWSDAKTWENARPPKAGDRVQVKPGHVVTYDVAPDNAVSMRMVHVGGTLSFSREKSTRMDVGLLKIQPGEACSEDGFVCSAHEEALKVEKKNDKVPAPVEATVAAGPLPAAVEIGTPERPIPVGVTATVRLVYFEGGDKETLPAVITCGGRWDVHGAPLRRTWLKLARPAAKGSDTVEVEESMSDWRAGDRVLVTAGRKDYEGESDESETEERLVVSIDGTALKLDKPLAYDHVASDEGRCEVANLSRNVVVESTDPAGVRGHTMYHRHSTGSISYAEFRHLGKEGILGKYPIHFHVCRDGMRGGGVTGASIWDSKNRWMAIHGTDYLLVRDCVGYKSVGHGFFLEDGTEQYNILDRNLAVQAMKGKRLKDQALPFDQNEGAGFWWANGRNTFTRNVACENHRYGFRFEIGKVGGKPPAFALRQPDGTFATRDVRHIPFLRFEDNESHSEGLYSFFFGDDPAGSVGGDVQHPFVARNLRAWNTHYAIRPNLTHFLMEKLDINGAVYGVYHPDYDAHVYRDVRVNRVGSEPINRGHDDESIQFGSFTYDGLTIENCPGQPNIQLTCTSPTDGQTGHFRNLKVITKKGMRNNQVVDLGTGPILPDKELKRPVTYFFHDATEGGAGSVGSPGKALRVVSSKFPDEAKGGNYKVIPGFTGKRVLAAEVDAVPFPKLLDPVDDLPPATMITSVRQEGGKQIVRGVSQDDGMVVSISVNGQLAEIKSNHAGVADWEATIEAGGEPVKALATDRAGNGEKIGASVR